MCGMGRRQIWAFSVAVAIICAMAFLAPGIVAAQSGPTALAGKMRAQRSSPTDLELSGDLAGVPRGESRFLAREDLLAISQPMTISPDDGNFKQSTQVRGVPLEDLIHELRIPSNDMLLADCKDKYQAHYERRYLANYHPVLVTALNGTPLRNSGDDDYGPYMIAHINFKMVAKAPALNDEPQIPWGVVRLQFRDEESVFGAIAPRGTHAGDEAVQDGFKIAQQNCFRCHNNDAEGGLKSRVTWTVLGAMAANSPDFFTEYVRDPQAKNPKTQMAASPEYDDATMRALIAYFRTFAAEEAH
jgi:mono/diheme cytochrome c family protein